MKSQHYSCLVSQAYPSDIYQANLVLFGVVAPRGVGAYVVSNLRLLSCRTEDVASVQAVVWAVAVVLSRLLRLSTMWAPSP